MSSASGKRHTQLNFGSIKSTDDSVAVTSEVTQKKANVPAQDQRSTVPLKLTLVEAAKAHVRPHEYLKVIHASPWTEYARLYDLRVGPKATFTAVESSPPSHGKLLGPCTFSRMALVRTWSKIDSKKDLEVLQKVRHENFLQPLSSFHENQEVSVVFEFMTIPLSNVAGHRYLDDEKLAFIIHEVFTSL